MRGVIDEHTGERVAMAVYVPAGVVVDVPSVLAGLEGAGLAQWKLPETIVRYDAPLPTTATGKVQRRVLSEDGGVLWRADRLSAS